MTPRDVFEAARECAIDIREHNRMLEQRRSCIGVQGHSYEVHSKSDILDPMRKVDDLIEWERANDVTDLEEQIEEARTMARGIPDPLMAEVTERFYCDGESMDAIAIDVGARVGALVALPHYRRVAALEQALRISVAELDHVGIAKLKQMGQSAECAL